MTPPLANGVSPAGADGEAPPMLANRLPSPPARSFASGLNALVTARLDSRSASDFNTSSNCLPPTTASLNALLIALANCVALTPSALVLVLVLSTVPEMSGTSIGADGSTKLIGITRHQLFEPF